MLYRLALVRIISELLDVGDRLLFPLSVIKDKVLPSFDEKDFLCIVKKNAHIEESTDYDWMELTENTDCPPSLIDFPQSLVGKTDYQDVNVMSAHIATSDSDTLQKYNLSDVLNKHTPSGSNTKHTNEKHILSPSHALKRKKRSQTDINKSPKRFQASHIKLVPLTSYKEPFVNLKDLDKNVTFTVRASEADMPSIEVAHSVIEVPRRHGSTTSDVTDKPNQVPDMFSQESLASKFPSNIRLKAVEINYGHESSNIATTKIHSKQTVTVQTNKIVAPRRFPCVADEASKNPSCNNLGILLEKQFDKSPPPYEDESSNIPTCEEKQSVMQTTEMSMPLGAQLSSSSHVPSDQHALGKDNIENITDVKVNTTQEMPRQISPHPLQEPVVNPTVPLSRPFQVCMPDTVITQQKVMPVLPYNPSMMDSSTKEPGEISKADLSKLISESRVFPVDVFNQTSAKHPRATSTPRAPGSIQRFMLQPRSGLATSTHALSPSLPQRYRLIRLPHETACSVSSTFTSNPSQTSVSIGQLGSISSQKADANVSRSANRLPSNQNREKKAFNRKRTHWEVNTSTCSTQAQEAKKSGKPTIEEMINEAIRNSMGAGGKTAEPVVTSDTTSDDSSPFSSSSSSDNSNVTKPYEKQNDELMACVKLFMRSQSMMKEAMTGLLSASVNMHKDLSVLEEDLEHERQLNNILSDEITRLSECLYELDETEVPRRNMIVKYGRRRMLAYINKENSNKAPLLGISCSSSTSSTNTSTNTSSTSSSKKDQGQGVYEVKEPMTCSEGNISQESLMVDSLMDVTDYDVGQAKLKKLRNHTTHGREFGNSLMKNSIVIDQKKYKMTKKSGRLLYKIKRIPPKVQTASQNSHVGCLTSNSNGVKNLDNIVLKSKSSLLEKYLLEDVETNKQFNSTESFITEKQKINKDIVQIKPKNQVPFCLSRYNKFSSNANRIKSYNTLKPLKPLSSTFSSQEASINLTGLEIDSSKTTKKDSTQNQCDKSSIRCSKHTNHNTMLDHFSDHKEVVVNDGNDLSVSDNQDVSGRSVQDIVCVDLECYMCDFVGTTLKRIAKHMLSAHNIQLCFICKVCSRGFRDIGTLSQHVHHSCSGFAFSIDEIGVTLCNRCHLQNDDAIGMALHFKFHHAMARNYKCRFCGLSRGKEEHLMGHVLWNEDCFKALLQQIRL